MAVSWCHNNSQALPLLLPCLATTHPPFTRPCFFSCQPDGRGGDQPRQSSIIGNLVREIGIWQKQSSMWFQAATAQTHLAGNVHFNGPRAGFNFNVSGWGRGGGVTTTIVG